MTPARLVLAAEAAAWTLSGALALVLLHGATLGREYARAGFWRPCARSVQLAIAAAWPWVLAAVAAAFLGAWLVTRRTVDARRAWNAAATAAGVATGAFLFVANGVHFRRVLKPASVAWTLLAVALVFAVALAARRGMISRRFGGTVIAASIFLAAGAAIFARIPLAAPAVAARPPNVVLILIDALRADGLGAFGNPRPASPHLDALARESVVFRRAIAQGTFTKTSMTSLMTGLYPFRHGVYEGNLKDKSDRITSDVVPESLTLLAERLRERGWLTMAWVQQAHLASYLGFAQGYVSYREGQGKLPALRPRVESWLKSHGRLGPFFGYVHIIDLHDPYHPPSPWDVKFGRYADFYAKARGDSWSAYLRDINEGRVALDAADVAQWRALYDGMIGFVDAEVGRLLETLRREGLYDDALIVVTADHGDAFMEHGFISHSNTAYDELVHVPLIVKLPRGRLAGTVVARQVRLVDVVPTILDAIGAPPAEGLDGRSLLPVAGGAEHPVEAVTEFERGVAIRTDGVKYVLFLDGRAELYDLAADPGETRNLSGAGDAREEEFAHKARLLLSARLARKGGERVPLEPRTIEELRSLGYIR
jgi:arylsulfatase